MKLPFQGSWQSDRPLVAPLHTVIEIAGPWVAFPRSPGDGPLIEGRSVAFGGRSELDGDGTNHSMVVISAGHGTTTESFIVRAVTDKQLEVTQVASESRGPVLFRRTDAPRPVVLDPKAIDALWSAPASVDEHRWKLARVIANETCASIESQNSRRFAGCREAAVLAWLEAPRDRDPADKPATNLTGTLYEHSLGILAALSLAQELDRGRYSTSNSDTQLFRVSAMASGLGLLGRLSLSLEDAELLPVVEAYVRSDEYRALMSALAQSPEADYLERNESWRYWSTRPSQ
ncbi:MAG: hypothetical protein B7733_20010 [Myxococcales bacterium FL481]|nr:MAG: hypothetical protein B7733_20010 [Myxococcales bacterium FL481]